MIKELLNKNYFELFGVTTKFAIDIKELKQTMLFLQKQFHPDNYNETEHTESELDDVLELSSNINQAYQILLNPSSRAFYLLSVLGQEVPEDDEEIIQDPELLMQQMELRQKIDEAFIQQNTKELDSIEEEINKNITNIEAMLSDLFVNHQYEEINKVLPKLLFNQKALNMIES